MLAGRCCKGPARAWAPNSRLISHDESHPSFGAGFYRLASAVASLVLVAFWCRRACAHIINPRTTHSAAASKWKSHCRSGVRVRCGVRRRRMHESRKASTQSPGGVANPSRRAGQDECRRALLPSPGRRRQPVRVPAAQIPCIPSEAGTRIGASHVMGGRGSRDGHARVTRRGPACTEAPGGGGRENKQGAKAGRESRARKQGAKPGGRCPHRVPTTPTRTGEESDQGGGQGGRWVGEGNAARPETARGRITLAAGCGPSVGPGRGLEAGPGGPGAGVSREPPPGPIAPRTIGVVS
jgi:hypothetical protein